MRIADLVRLYLLYISPISPLYLPYISLISPKSSMRIADLVRLMDP